MTLGDSGLRFSARTEHVVNHMLSFKPEDRSHLLGVIESGYGSFDAFNQRVRSMLAPEVFRVIILVFLMVLGMRLAVRWLELF